MRVGLENDNEDAMSGRDGCHRAASSTGTSPSSAASCQAIAITRPGKRIVAMTVGQSQAWHHSLPLNATPAIWSEQQTSSAPSPAPPGRRAYAVDVRRAVFGALRMFLFFAILGHFLERVGATRCGCVEECWCKRPGLALFRWVIPWGHRFPGAA
jgi:hypothetical protein